MISMLHVIDIFAILHSVYLYGKRWTVLFFIIGFTLPFVTEHVGASYGWVFGKYHYQPDRLMIFGTVPVLVPVAWWLILYCSYNTTNLIFGRFHTLKQDRRRIPLAVFLMACLDGLMAMNFDMMLDPIMVCPERQRWVWEFGGSYFNIPIQNFIGWFVVGFCISLLIRIYDAWKGTFVSLGDRFVHYLPSGLYFSMFLLIALLSIVDGYPQYALIGFSTMMPFIFWAGLRAVQSLQIASRVERDKAS